MLCGEKDVMKVVCVVYKEKMDVLLFIVKFDENVVFELIKVC